MILPLALKLNLCLKTSIIPCNDLFPQVLEPNNLRYYIIFEFEKLGNYRWCPLVDSPLKPIQGGVHSQSHHLN